MSDNKQQKRLTLRISPAAARRLQLAAARQSLPLCKAVEALIMENYDAEGRRLVVIDKAKKVAAKECLT